MWTRCVHIASPHTGLVEGCAPKPPLCLTRVVAKICILIGIQIFRGGIRNLPCKFAVFWRVEYALSCHSSARCAGNGLKPPKGGAFVLLQRWRSGHFEEKGEKLPPLKAP